MLALSVCRFDFRTRIVLHSTLEAPAFRKTSKGSTTLYARTINAAPKTFVIRHAR